MSYYQLKYFAKAFLHRRGNRIDSAHLVLKENGLQFWCLRRERGLGLSPSASMPALFTKIAPNEKSLMETNELHSAGEMREVWSQTREENLSTLFTIGEGKHNFKKTNKSTL